MYAKLQAWDYCVPFTGCNLRLYCLSNKKKAIKLLCCFIVVSSSHFVIVRLVPIIHIVRFDFLLVSLFEEINQQVRQVSIDMRAELRDPYQS